MEKLRLTILFLIFAYCLEVTRAECNIEVQNISPIFSKKIEKEIIILPSNQRSLTLKNGEEITAHCSSGISFRRDNNNLISDNTVLNMSIECNMNGDGMKMIADRDLRIYDSHGHSRRSVYDSRGRTIYIECDQEIKQLFESNTALEGCTNFRSLGIGTLLPELKTIVFAGICFDIHTLTTKYVKYLARSPKNHLVFVNKNNSSGDFISNMDKLFPDLEKTFRDINAIAFKISFIDKQRENPLLALHKYEFVNIIQDNRVSAEIQDFAYMLNTIWWQNLRLGSWKYFLDALHKRTEEVEYIIYTGISGKLTIPSATNGKENEFMRTLFNIMDVPEIIWTYVKPVKANKNDEFVVFAYNTPFYSADNETISCKDVCNEIDWLDNENFKITRLLPTFGVMHCCRVPEIASQLDVFPVFRQ